MSMQSYLSLDDMISPIQVNRYVMHAAVFRSLCIYKRKNEVMIGFWV